MAEIMAEQKEKIWTAAKKCFREIGLKKMTLADVARESGLSEKGVKAIYKDVNSIITDLMTKGIDDVTAILEKSVQARGKADVKISRFVKTLLADYEIHAPLSKLVSINFESLDEECLLLRNLLTQEQIDRHRLNTAIIGRIIAEGQSEGIFRNADPLECAHYLRGIIQWAIRFWIATKYEGELADFSDRITRIFFTGMYK